MYLITIKLKYLKFYDRCDDWKTVKECLNAFFKEYQNRITGYKIEKINA